MLKLARTKVKKLAFCITCMNRLSHIQETLVKNMEDNFRPDEVEFILLDYNSSDGLEEWVKTLKKYIEQGILTYYRTITPESYHRSHSRNMAFRLSNAVIVCNLDADNFLGPGFAEYVLTEFEKQSKEKIFITTTCTERDTFGKFCAYRDDFMQIKGYNESLVGYGVEDLDLFDRFIRNGLQQTKFNDRIFCEVIFHPHEDRVSQEYRFKQLENIYLSYISPFQIKFLVLYKDQTYETGILIDNMRCNYNHNKNFSNIIESFFDGIYRIMFEDSLEKGNWFLEGDKIRIIRNNNTMVFCTDALQINCNEFVFYRIQDKNIISEIIMYLSDAVNFEIARQLRNNQSVINPDGFGKGVVYKNFDYKYPIILE